MALLASIWRYPLKAASRESLQKVKLERGAALPLDRQWAVLHEGGGAHLGDDGRLDDWLPKSQFLRGASAPALQAVSGGLTNGRLELCHPDLEPLSVDPTRPDDQARLIDWLRPLWPGEKPLPLAVVSAPVPLTDTPERHVSVLSRESLAQLEQHVGRRLGEERWRGNLWIDGWEPFAENDLIGRSFALGAARLKICEPITRCHATSVDPETGEADLDMPAALVEHLGHARFGVYAEVVESGEVSLLDEVILLDEDSLPDEDSRSDKDSLPEEDVGA